MLPPPWTRTLAVTGRALDEGCARDWSARTLAARDEWIGAFAAEQFSLGRAFYTHYEEGQAERYFSDAAASDLTVERHLPGMQARVRSLLSAQLGAEVRARRGWCGAGVHVFPAGGHVARRGGVLHADTEGLTAHHMGARLPAVSFVVMLQGPARGGGLRLWDTRYDGDDALPDDARPRARTVRPRAGAFTLIDSYRFHQIAPFAGDVDRISITLHAAQTSAGFWESWF